MTEPIPKSKRCTSKWGYALCERLRHHAGTCKGRGFEWYRGRGHSRPILVHDPWKRA